MSRFIDLSHVIENELITYKGLPAPIICDYLSREQARAHYADGVTFQIDKIEMVGNTGTYLDSPFHRWADGADIATLDLQQVAHLEGLLVRIPPTNGPAIDADHFQNLQFKGKAVLIHTGWDKHWKTDQYYENHPYLTEAAALTLRDGGAALVGIDSHNIDNVADKRRPVHSILLRHGVLICEHMCHLERLPQGQAFRFYAVPAKFKAVGTFPVRAFALLSE